MTNKVVYLNDYIMYSLLGQKCDFRIKYVGVDCNNIDCTKCNKLLSDWFEAECRNAYLYKE